MGGLIDSLLQWMQGLPPALVYLVVGVFAALENIFPPVPADVIALFGGFLTGQGVGHPLTAFLIVWLANSASAMFTYWIGRRYGLGFFQGRLGRLILRPGQMARLSAFYQRHGLKVIFASRYLPGFRAVVPVFAGTSGIGPVRTAVPILLASGLWYAMLVYLGATAGANWEAIRDTVDASGRWLAVAAGALMAAVAWWWWKTRHEEHPDPDHASGDPPPDRT
ncbi:MAG TPA: DedA family protein [Longimicrobium sp.]